MLIIGFRSNSVTTIAASTGTITTVTPSSTASDLTGNIDSLVREVRDRWRHAADPTAEVRMVDDVSPYLSAHELVARWEEGDLTPFPVALNTLKTRGRVDESVAEPASIHPAVRRVDERDEPLPSEGVQFTRPNGDTYLARSLVAHTDVAVLRRCRVATPHWLGVLLVGPAGSGKTAVAEVAHPGLVTVQGHGDMTVPQLVGQHMPTRDGGWQFAAGPLTVAMQTGAALLVDEVNKIPAEVLAVLHSAMDGRGTIRLDDRPADPIVTAQPGFCVVGTLNPDTLGGTGLPEAIASRFPVQIVVRTDLDAARALGVPDDFVAVADNIATYNRENPTMPDVWEPQMRELLAAKTMIDCGLGVEFAARAMLAACPRPEDMPIVTERMQLVFGIEDLAPLELGPHA